MTFSWGVRPQARSYDLPTAVTFLLAGLGIGSMLAVVFAPRAERPSAAKSSSTRLTAAL